MYIGANWSFLQKARVKPIVKMAFHVGERYLKLFPTEPITTPRRDGELWGRRLVWSRLQSCWKMPWDSRQERLRSPVQIRATPPIAHQELAPFGEQEAWSDDFESCDAPDQSAIRRVGIARSPIRCDESHSVSLTRMDQFHSLTCPGELLLTNGAHSLI